MGFQFSKTSLEKLNSAHSDLQFLFNAVLRLGFYDLTVTEGLRSLATQQQYVKEGKSKTLDSKHLTGDAVDVAIFKGGKIDYEDVKAYYHLAGIVNTVAQQYGIKCRWGGNWDSDADMNDQSFNDLVHWELVK